MPSREDLAALADQAAFMALAKARDLRLGVILILPEPETGAIKRGGGSGLDLVFGAADGSPADTIGKVRAVSGLGEFPSTLVHGCRI